MTKAELMGTRGRAEVSVAATGSFSSVINAPFLPYTTAVRQDWGGRKRNKLQKRRATLQANDMKYHLTEIRHVDHDTDYLERTGKRAGTHYRANLSAAQYSGIISIVSVKAGSLYRICSRVVERVTLIPSSNSNDRLHVERSLSM